MIFVKKKFVIFGKSILLKIKEKHFPENQAKFILWLESIFHWLMTKFSHPKQTWKVWKMVSWKLFSINTNGA